MGFEFVCIMYGESFVKSRGECERTRRMQVLLRVLSRKCCSVDSCYSGITHEGMSQHILPDELRHRKRDVDRDVTATIRYNASNTIHIITCTIKGNLIALYAETKRTGSMFG